MRRYIVKLATGKWHGPGYPVDNYWDAVQFGDDSPPGSLPPGEVYTVELSQPRPYTATKEYPTNAEVTKALKTFFGVNTATPPRFPIAVGDLLSALNSYADVWNIQLWDAIDRLEDKLGCIQCDPDVRATLWEVQHWHCSWETGVRIFQAHIYGRRAPTGDTVADDIIQNKLEYHPLAEELYNQASMMGLHCNYGQCTTILLEKCKGMSDAEVRKQYPSLLSELVLW